MVYKKREESSVDYLERMKAAIAEITGQVTLEQVEVIALKHKVSTSGLLTHLDVDWARGTARPLKEGEQ